LHKPPEIKSTAARRIGPFMGPDEVCCSAIFYFCRWQNAQIGRIPVYLQCAGYRADDQSCAAAPERGGEGKGRLRPGRRWLRVSHRVLNRVSHRPPTAFTTVPTGFSKAAEKLQPERKPIETMEKAIEGLWKTPIENPMENPPQSQTWIYSRFIAFL